MIKLIKNILQKWKDAILERRKRNYQIVFFQFGMEKSDNYYIRYTTNVFIWHEIEHFLEYVGKMNPILIDYRDDKKLKYYKEKLSTYEKLLIFKKEQKQMESDFYIKKWKNQKEIEKKQKQINNW